MDDVNLGYFWMEKRLIFYLFGTLPSWRERCAVESVQAMRKLDPTAGTITLSAADLLNLVGILVPGERVPAISGNSVSYRDGAAVPLSAMTASPTNQSVAS